MTLPSVTDAAYPTPNEIRDGILRAIAFAFARRGLVANVLPGSEHFIRAEKYAGRVAIAIANNALALADSDPLTSTGTALVVLAGVFGVPPRPAGPSGGSVTIVCSGLVSIPAAFQLTAPNGKKYETAGLNTAIPTGTAVSIIAVVGGADTNQDAGTILTWDSAAIGALNSRATVTAAGLTGGANADDDDALRARLLAQLANPPGGGNSAQIVKFTEDSTASVERAYAYPAVQGPASVDVAVTAAGGSRTLSAAIVALARGYVVGKMPGQQEINVTSVTSQGVDVVLSAVLPFPLSAGGAGGGWRDASPWPIAGEDAKVTAYDSGTGTATVDAIATPAVGNTIGIWDRVGVVMREYTIATVGGSTGAWTITVQGGFVAVPTGAYVSAGALFLAQYATAFSDAVLALGPGEKTASPEILPRGRRFPSTEVNSPADLTSLQTALVQRQFPEIADLNYALRVATGTLTPLTGASIPATTADPPNVLTLKEFAIRPQ